MALAPKRIARYNQGMSRKERTAWKASEPWTPERWEDGFVDASGYFVVYRPDHPNASGSGRARRYHVVYWLRTGLGIPAGMVIHHEDRNRLNDQFENLRILTRSEHRLEHAPEQSTATTKPCPRCGKAMFFQWGSLVDRKKFCSPECETPTIARPCAGCGKEMILRPCRLRQRYCSSECYHAAPLTDKQVARLKLPKKQVRKGEELTCPVCSEVFYRPPSQRVGKILTCSRPCSGVLKRKQPAA